MFVKQHAGLNIRGITQEIYFGSPAFARQAGFRIRADFSDDARVAHLSADARPMLIGITRDEILASPGHIGISGVFMAFSPPRYMFDRSQRDLLALALENESDDFASGELGISPAAVKKRWTTIYDRINEVDPTILPSTLSRRNGVRGTELRRHVLRYIREHPGELHPFSP